MPRRRRQYGNGVIYHVLVRGNDKQVMFHDNDDFTYYLHLQIAYSEKLGFILHAYCHMNNHAHLVIEDKHSVVSVA